jgi:hypothetical protein
VGERLGTQPWRFDAAQYRRAAARRRDLRPLGDRPARMPAGALADALEEVARTLPEELVCDDLVGDLRHGRHRTAVSSIGTSEVKTVHGLLLYSTIANERCA